MSTASTDEALSGAITDQLSRQLPEQARRHLDALRGAIDVRLAALDAALADPSRSGTLESLILDLARVATTEAQAAAAKACVDTRLAADTETARVAAAAQQRLQQERAATAELRGALEAAKQQAARLEADLGSDLRRTREALEAEVARGTSAAAETERAVTSARQGLADAHRERDEARTTGTTLRRSLDEVRAQAARIETDLAAELRSTREALEAEIARGKSTASDTDRTLAEIRRDLTEAARERDEERAISTDLRQSLARADERLVDVGRDHAQMQGARDRAVADLERAREAVAALQRAVDDAQAQIETERNAQRAFERTRAEVDQRLITIQREHAQALTVYQELQASYEELADRFTRERAAGAEALRRASTLSSDLEATRHTLDAERATTADLRRAAADVTAQLNALGPEHSETRALHVALISDLQTERSRLEALEQGRAELTRQLADLSRQLGEERAATAVAAEAARADAERWRARLATLTPERDEARAAYERAASDLEAARLTVSRLERSQADLEQSLEAERAAGASVRRAVEQAEHRLASVMGNQVQAMTHAEELERALLGARQEIATLSARVEAAEGERDAADRRLMEIEARLARAVSGPAESAPFETVHPPAAAPPAPSPAESTWGPVRLADRYAFRDPIGVQINSEDGLLCDLSILGCQLIATSTLKPNQKVKVTLPVEPAPLVCGGKVMWAKLETLPKGRGFVYRAGVQFLKPDHDAIDAFIAGRHDAGRR